MAYVDDLTVRTGRVVDGNPDKEADQEIRVACQKAPVSAGQDAASPPGALSLKVLIKIGENMMKGSVTTTTQLGKILGSPLNGVLGSRVHAGLAQSILDRKISSDRLILLHFQVSIET